MVEIHESAVVIFQMQVYQSPVTVGFGVGWKPPDDPVAEIECIPRPDVDCIGGRRAGVRVENLAVRANG